MRNREKKEKNCLYCGESIPNRNVYCDNKCQGMHKREKIFKLLEEGKFDQFNRMDVIDVNTRRYLIHKHGSKCMKCGWDHVNPFTNRIPVQLNHIDGNPENHNLKNCELLCPSCHSLTEFFGSRGGGRKERYKDAGLAHRR